jgi:hypothetical protein
MPSGLSVNLNDIILGPIGDSKDESQTANCTRNHYMIILLCYVML